MLLTQNREMRADGIWNFTLPAWVIELDDGSHFNVCPNAGACAKFCYARNGTYLFPVVKAKHRANLTLVKDDPRWPEAMLGELARRKFRPSGKPRIIPGLASADHLSPQVQEWAREGGQALRIHDSGDFFSMAYFSQWMTVVAAQPDVLFYAYTKQVSMLQPLTRSGTLPPNMLIVYSLGGREDGLLNHDIDRHADVFASLAAVVEAGYSSQHESDLLSVLLPTTRIGIPANNIRHFNARLAGKTFSEAQLLRKKRTHTTTNPLNP